MNVFSWRRPLAWLAIGALAVVPVVVPNGLADKAAANSDALVLEIETDSSPEVWGLNLSGDVCVVIDWGDESDLQAENTPGTKTHSYTNAGTYIVTVSPGGGCQTPFLTGLGITQVSTYNNKITSVISFGNLGLTSLNDAFRGATKLRSVPATIPETVIDLEGTFLGASAFNQDLNGWLPEGNNVRFLHEMFESATSFNGDISQWDVSNVETMDEMFNFASSFNQDISGWDVRKVSTMEEMFEGATKFNQDLSAWVFSGITNKNRFARFVRGSGLDSANYSKLLISLASQTLPNEVQLGDVAANPQFRLPAHTCESLAARDILIGKSWVLTDGGLLVDAPTITSITAGAQSASVAFNAPACGPDITNYEYSLNGGSFVAFQPPTTVSPLVISGLSDGTDYEISMRAVRADSTIVASSALQFSTASFGRIRTTDYGTAPTSGGAYCWRGYAVQMAQDTEVTGLIGGGTTALSANNEFRGAIYAANTSSSGSPTSPGAVLAEVVYKGNTVNQEVLFASSDDSTVPVRPANNTLMLEKDTWYYIMQGSLKGFTRHWYVTSLNAPDLIAASSRIADWLPGMGAPGQAFFGECDVVASGNSNRSLSTTSDKPAVGLIYKTSASALPEVSTLESPLQGLLSNRGGASTALYMEYGTALVNASAGPACITSPATSVTEHPGCDISTIGLQLNLAESSYAGEVPYSYGATLVGLNPGTRYFYRARAINDAGRADGVVRSFRTDPAPGSPTIVAATGLDGALSLDITSVAPTDLVGLTTTFRYRVRLVSDGPWANNDVGWVSRSPSGASSPLVIPGLINGEVYQVQIQAVGSGVIGGVSAIVTATPAEPPPAPPTPAPAPSAPAAAPAPPPVVPTVTPIAPRPPQRVTLPIQPSIQSGPVLRNNVVTPPPVAPTGSINGVPTTVSSLVTDPTQLNLRTGVLNIAVNVNPQQGLVRQGTGGETEVQVRSGGTTALSGSGLAPRSTVQVFMPLQGGNAKELARIPVDATGSFSGDAVFATSLQDAPIPVGRQTLQMVTLDEQGRQAVVELTVNIAQPPPAPERNREAGVTPQLLPGQSLATNAGIPEAVQVFALPDQKQTVIQGDGWSMAVDVSNPDASVEEGPDGSVTLKLVRDEEARVSGNGFMPLTRADVWLFSEPTLLGTVDIDENGEFNGLVNVDGNVVTVGEHTLQLQGVGMDGYVRAANLGVIVGDEQALATQEQAQSLLWLLWVLLAVVVATGGGYVAWKARRRSEQTS